MTLSHPPEVKEKYPVRENQQILINQLTESIIHDVSDSDTLDDHLLPESLARLNHEVSQRDNISDSIEHWRILQEAHRDLKKLIKQTPDIATDEYETLELLLPPESLAQNEIATRLKIGEGHAEFYRASNEQTVGQG